MTQYINGKWTVLTFLLSLNALSDRSLQEAISAVFDVSVYCIMSIYSQMHHELMECGDILNM